jgi:hypothetical protein
MAELFKSKAEKLKQSGSITAVTNVFLGAYERSHTKISFCQWVKSILLYKNTIDFLHYRMQDYFFKKV